MAPFSPVPRFCNRHALTRCSELRSVRSRSSHLGSVLCSHTEIVGASTLLNYPLHSWEFPPPRGYFSTQRESFSPSSCLALSPPGRTNGSSLPSRLDSTSPFLYTRILRLLFNRPPQPHFPLQPCLTALIPFSPGIPRLLLKIKNFRPWSLNGIPP